MDDNYNGDIDVPLFKSPKLSLYETSIQKMTKT